MDASGQPEECEQTDERKGFGYRQRGAATIVGIELRDLCPRITAAQIRGTREHEQGCRKKRQWPDHRSDQAPARGRFTTTITNRHFNRSHHGLLSLVGMTLKNDGCRVVGPGDEIPSLGLHPRIERASTQRSMTSHLVADSVASWAS